MNARMLIPSKYFSAADFEGEPTVTIESVDFTDLEVEGKNGKASTTERRGALKLREFAKPWVCNVTNTKCIIAMFGEENAEKTWPGKRLKLHVERVMSFGEWVPGVRITGSPDITAPVTVSLKLRKKKAQAITMQVTSTATPRPTPPGPVAPRVAMWNLWKSSGQTDGKAFWALVRTATGKGDEKQLTAADVPLFEAAMRRSPDDDPPPPPPPLSDDEQREILAREAALSNGAGA